MLEDGKFEEYESGLFRQRWRWRYRSTNGNIIFVSAEAYRDYRDMKRSMQIAMDTTRETPVIQVKF